MDANVASLWSSAWQRLSDQAATAGFASTLRTAFGGGEGVTAEDLEGLRQALLAENQLGLTLEVAAVGEPSGWDGATGTIRLAPELLAEGTDPALAQRALLEQIGRALDARLHGGTEAWGLAGGKLFANLLLGPAANDAAPSLSSAAAILLQDTPAQDSFTPTSGTLQASDPEQARLRYGLEGASQSSTELDGVRYDLSKAGVYGTLYGIAAAAPTASSRRATGRSMPSAPAARTASS